MVGARAAGARVASKIFTRSWKLLKFLKLRYLTELFCPANLTAPGVDFFAIAKDFLLSIVNLSFTIM
jgi:hypothetical protein